MKITNIHGLPQPLVNLFAKETYTRGRADVSVTELIGSPRISILKEKHHAELTEDISDRFWAVMGTNIHRILEQGADDDHLTEERLFLEVEGWMVSGGIDLQVSKAEGISIIDWKFVSTYSVKAPKEEWEKQLNCYAHLVRQAKRVPVQRLQVCAIVRDWLKSRAAQSPDYPQQPIQMIEIPLWEPERAEAFVLDRVRSHKEARRAEDWGEGLPHCSDQEKWLRGSAWAVTKKGGKRATKVCSSQEEAERYTLEVEGNWVIEMRPGEAVRCTNNYCGVADHCDQFKKV